MGLHKNLGDSKVDGPTKAASKSKGCIKFAQFIERSYSSNHKVRYVVYIQKAGFRYYTYPEQKILLIRHN